MYACASSNSREVIVRFFRHLPYNHVDVAVTLCCVIGKRAINDVSLRRRLMFSLGSRSVAIDVFNGISWFSRRRFPVSMRVRLHVIFATCLWRICTLKRKCGARRIGGGNYETDDHCIGVLFVFHRLQSL